MSRACSSCKKKCATGEKKRAEVDADVRLAWKILSASVDDRLDADKLATAFQMFDFVPEAGQTVGVIAGLSTSAGGDGCIGSEDFVTVLKHKVLTRSTWQEAVNIFNIFVGQQVGKVSFADLQRVCSGRGLNDEQLHDMIRLFDEDGDGKLNISEFSAALASAGYAWAPEEGGLGADTEATNGDDEREDDAAQSDVPVDAGSSRGGLPPWTSRFCEAIEPKSSYSRLDPFSPAFVPIGGLGHRPGVGPWSVATALGKASGGMDSRRGEEWTLEERLVACEKRLRESEAENAALHERLQLVEQELCQERQKQGVHSVQQNLSSCAVGAGGCSSSRRAANAGSLDAEQNCSSVPRYVNVLWGPDLCPRGSLGVSSEDDKGDRGRLGLLHLPAGSAPSSSVRPAHVVHNPSMPGGSTSVDRAPPSDPLEGAEAASRGNVDRVNDGVWNEAAVGRGVPLLWEQTASTAKAEQEWQRAQLWTRGARLTDEARAYFLAPFGAKESISLHDFAQCYLALRSVVQRAAPESKPDLDEGRRATRAAMRAVRNALMWRCVRDVGIRSCEAYFGALDEAFGGVLQVDSELKSQVMNTYHRTFGSLAAAFKSRSARTAERRGRKRPRKRSGPGRGAAETAAAVRPEATSVTAAVDFVGSADHVALLAPALATHLAGGTAGCASVYGLPFPVFPQETDGDLWVTWPIPVDQVSTLKWT